MSAVHLQEFNLSQDNKKCNFFLVCGMTYKEMALDRPCSVQKLLLQEDCLARTLCSRLKLHYFINRIPQVCQVRAVDLSRERETWSIVHACILSLSLPIHVFTSIVKKIFIYLLACLRIQQPLIRSRYYLRNAKTDVCDSPPEIPY